MGRRDEPTAKQRAQAKTAILAAMTRRAISGDTRAARIVLGEQGRITIEGGNFDALNKAFEEMEGIDLGGETKESNSR